jgi:hypothetical protein
MFRDLSGGSGIRLNLHCCSVNGTVSIYRGKPFPHPKIMCLRPLTVTVIPITVEDLSKGSREIAKSIVKATFQPRKRSYTFSAPIATPHITVGATSTWGIKGAL